MKHFKLIVASLLLVGFAATPATADYLPGEEQKKERVESIDDVVKYLESSHFVPSRLEFRQLTADAVGDLVKVVKSKKYALKLRARALQSLPLYSNDERAVQLVDEMMTKTSPRSKLFGPAVIAYAAVHGESVTEAIAPYAEHPEPDVRMAAVVALGRFCGQAGFEMVRNLIPDEPDPEIRARMEQLVN